MPVVLCSVGRCIQKDDALLTPEPQKRNVKHRRRKHVPQSECEGCIQRYEMAHCARPHWVRCAQALEVKGSVEYNRGLEITEVVLRGTVHARLRSKGAARKACSQHTTERAVSRQRKCTQVLLLAGAAV